MELTININKPLYDIPNEIYYKAAELFVNHIQEYLQEHSLTDGMSFYEKTFQDGYEPDILQIRCQFPLFLYNLPALRIGKSFPVGGNAHRFYCEHQCPSQQKKKFQIKKVLRLQKA
jgi:hypothetical protein